MDRNTFDLTFEQLIKETSIVIPKELLPDLPPSLYNPNVHGWHDFEHEIWAKGESIRQLIYNEHKKLNLSQVNSILNICANITAKRVEKVLLCS